MRFNRTLSVSLVLTVIIAGALATQALSFGGHRHGGGLFGLKRVLELNLSDSQRSQIMSIFGKYDLKSVGSNLWQARKDLRTALSQATTEDSIDGIVSAYLTKVAPLQQQMLSMRAKMVYEIKAVLTPDQLQMLQQHKHGPAAGSSGTTTQ